MATQGRFTSPDEFKGGPDEVFVLGRGDPEKQALGYADVNNPQSLNKYQFVFNNPLRYVDPDGRSPQDRLEIEMRRAEREFPEGKITREEFLARVKAWGVGGVTGAALVLTGVGGPRVALAILAWATRNPEKAQQLAQELNQASTGSPVPGPPGLTVSAGTRLTASEISTGVRLAEQTGLRLSESAHVGAEFVSAAGKTYDAMGSAAAFANKSVDHVAIDLAGASNSQVAAIQKYVSGLTKEQQAKIIYVR